MKTTTRLKKAGLWGVVIESPEADWVDTGLVWTEKTVREAAELIKAAQLALP